MTGSEAAATGPGWAIVAGGAGSLGCPIAGHLAAGGWRVLSLDRADHQAAHPQIAARTVDITDPAAVNRLLDEAIARRDPIRLLVNAVGLIWNEPVVTMRGASFQTHGIDSWRQVIEANLTAPFVLSSCVACRMARSGGGAIINFSSVAARGNAGQAAYSASKSGVEGLTRAMANELGPLGIRVNAIAPGFIDVPSTRAALSDDQLTAIGDRTPSRRLGQPGDIIAAIDFLAASPFVTGIVLDVNGGFRL